MKQKQLKEEHSKKCALCKARSVLHKIEVNFQTKRYWFCSYCNYAEQHEITQKKRVEK